MKFYFVLPFNQLALSNNDTRKFVYMSMIESLIRPCFLMKGVPGEFHYENDGDA